MTSYPPAGWIGLSPIAGSVGKLIELGQFLNGDGFRSWEHAFVSLGNGLIVEAEPGGARVAHGESYPVVHWCENIARQHTPQQLSEVAYCARTYTMSGVWGPHGVPYSFLDYGALVLHRLHIPAPGLRAYIASTRHQICSQLADQAYLDAGLHLYSDGRWPGYVTPLDLYNLDMSLGGQS